MTITLPETGLQPALDAFHERGFVVLRNVITGAHAADLRSRLEALLGPTPSPAPVQEVLPRIVERDSQFTDLATSHGMLTTASELLESAPLLACSYGHRKASRTLAHTGPHSDVAHLQGIPHHQSLVMIKVVVALTAVGPDNGRTVVLPGSHHGEGNEEPISVALEAGDMLLFHANLQHTATGNISSKNRLGLWFVFTQPWMRIFPGYEFSTDFLAAQRSRISADPRLRSVYGLADPYAT
jgi:ectoine hydroxylase-related dioxygenase (phytanoyl-CoA dioxygenase family)